jgi:uncharacterized protein
VDVRHHASGASLLRHAGPFLEEAEAENALILGICASPPPERGAPQLWLSIDTPAPVAVAIRTPPHHLALTRAPRAALVALVDDLQTQRQTLPGVLGPDESAHAFAELWTRASGLRHEVTMRQGIYCVTQVLPPSAPAPGALRPASFADVLTVAAWMAGFASDTAIPEAQHPALQQRARSLIEAGGLFIWEDADGPVSMAALNGPTPHGIRVSMVYTPAVLRGRGYASACVAAVSAHALASGRAFCMLYTDLANPTSNAIYQRIGYSLVCESNMIDFTEAPSGA